MEEDSLCSWIGRLNLVKRAVLPTLIYEFNSVLVNTPAAYLRDTDSLILKFVWKVQRPRRVLPETKPRPMLLDPKGYRRAAESQTWWWPKEPVSRWRHRTESLLSGPVSKISWCADRRARAFQWRKDSLEDKSCWNIWTLIYVAESETNCVMNKCKIHRNQRKDQWVWSWLLRHVRSADHKREN